jgi:hypothetical protein
MVRHKTLKIAAVVIQIPHSDEQRNSLRIFAVLCDFARNPVFVGQIFFSRQDAKTPGKRQVRKAGISIAELTFASQSDP